MSTQWNRLLWAVEFRSKSSCRQEGMLIGDTWQKVNGPDYPGEPLRALLFLTRHQANMWCAKKHEQCKQFGPDWKFRPVRVRETITTNVRNSKP